MNQDHHNDGRRRHSRATRPSAQQTLSRRQALALLGSGVATAAGCDSEETTRSATNETTETSAATPVAEGAGSSGTRWARGGTQALAASYPDPFATSSGAACSLTCRETLGPCYATTLVRRDISEGYPGLPLRLSLLVVDESCSPVPDASIDIWHTRNSGVYSGDDTGLGWDGAPIDFAGGAGAAAPPPPPEGAAAMPAFSCSLGDRDAESRRFFRGTQTTDANGRVDFDTCYPGWYAGRALHIHFVVRRDGREYVTSQLYFPDDLTREICESHPDYAEFGQPDTTNSTDQFFSGPEHMLDVARQSDGSMLASKTLVLRSSLDQALCGSDPLVPLPRAG